MRALRFFPWIVIPLALYLTYVIAGLPHFIWSYAWMSNGTSDPFAERHYTRCTFVGPYGRFTLRHPANGKCGFIIFRKDRGGRASG